MRILIRILVLALVASLPLAAPVAAAVQGTASGPAPADAAADAGLSTAKVVIIVGATHSATSHYRDIANAAYDEAIKYSSNVVKVYSPNATWSAVKAALQGASVVIYLGHGNGWPSPYTYDPNYSTKDGLGLNATAGNGDNNTKYYGEPYLAKEIKLAPNAVVLLNHLCYASGNSEPGHADPTVDQAMQRVDNYGQGFIKAGARAVIAEGHGSINGMIRDLFASHQTILDLWRNQWGYNGNEFSFTSFRSPAYRAFMDPDSPSGGFYRSLIGNPDLRTEDVTGVPFTPTDTTPDTLQSPGAATVGDGGVTLYADADLTWVQGSLDAGQAVRVEGLGGGAPSPDAAPTAAFVQKLNGWTSGWVATDALHPQDSLGPQLWGVDGPRTISANGDGNADTMSFALRFSESVEWSARVRDGNTTLWEASGSGDTTTLDWDARVGDAPIADGTYTLEITASDAWGNNQLATDILLTADTAPPSRLAGTDRYATAAAISTANLAPGVAVAYLATGLNFPDALAGAAAAGAQHAPILLVTKDSIPAATANELKRLKPGRIIILGATGVVSSAVETAARTYTTGAVTRLAGADRYATAAAISEATFAPGVPVAYIATGLNFPDALAGAAAAGAQGAPILLSTKDAVPDATKAELTRLQPARIVILGGTGAIGDGVKAGLARFTAGSVERVAGADRYATAAAISASAFAPGVDIAYIATGLNFPDALAGAAVAGGQGAPILLVAKDSIPGPTAAELDRLNPKRIVVLGSYGVVSEGVKITAQLYAS